MKTKKPRGSILLFTVVLVIPLMLIMVGVAVDLSMLYAARSEMHRAMDAGALAGAAELGFNNANGEFANARSSARTYAGLNAYFQTGTITLDLNPSNSNPAINTIPVGGGDIALGVWDGSTGQFDVPGCDITSSTCLHANGWPYYSMINAVRCRTRQSVPTYFLNLIGLTSLNTWAESIAPSYPPMTPPPDACTFPIGVSECPFRNAAQYGSTGCGNVISFIDANTNTSGWVNLGQNLGGTSNLEQTPSASTIRDEITIAAGGGGCTNPPPPGTSVGMDGGMVQSAFDLLLNVNPGSGEFQGDGGYFHSHYGPNPDTGGPFQVHNADESISYQGLGWEVYVPVVYSNNNCGTPENMNSPHTIATYAKIVIVQVINNGWCGENNRTVVSGNDPDTGQAYNASNPNPWTKRCPPPNGTAAARDSNLRAIYAFYDCGDWESNPVIVPAPRVALADRLRLVK